MSAVISATTKNFTRSTSRQEAKAKRFLASAHQLMNDARAHLFAEEADLAFESAYQAALRAAGACVAQSPVGKRKRLPTSAWDRLSLVGAQGADWASVFSKYSRTRAKLLNGQTVQITEREIRDFVAQVAVFVDEVAYGSEEPLLAA